MKILGNKTPETMVQRCSAKKVFCKKGVLKNFARFTGKHLCQCLFFNKVAGLSPASLLKKETLAQVFSGQFVKFLRTPFCRTLLMAASETLAIHQKKFPRFSVCNQNDFSMYALAFPVTEPSFLWFYLKFRPQQNLEALHNKSTSFNLC